MIWIPLYAIYYLITEPGTLRQVGIMNAYNNIKKIVCFHKIKFVFQKLQRGLTPIPEVNCRIEVKKESKNIVDKGLQLMECRTLVYCDNNDSKNI